MSRINQRTSGPAEPIRVWCDHGARHPWVASHVDDYGLVVDVIGRADTQEAAQLLADPQGLAHSVGRPDCNYCHGSGRVLVHERFRGGGGGWNHEQLCWCVRP